MTIDEIIARQGEIEQRKAEIEATLETPEADLDALNEEARQLMTEKAQLDEQLAELKKAAEEAEETRRKIADGELGDKEIRSSAEYCEAYKKYIITGDDKECRSLLSANATTPGDVPVPTVIEDNIKRDWERNAFLSRITKTSFRGNLKVPFEKSADPAYVHAEGTTGLTEEDLQLGVVELKPANVKKWIKISDEAVALGGEAFVQYIYDEMGYRVLNKLVSELVAKANAASTSHEATDICVVLNPLSIQAFNNAYAAGNFAINPFDGVTVIKCSALPAYSAASDNAMYAIVGDLKAFQANYPEGEGVIIKWDDLTYAEDDMVKVVARQYAGYGVTAPGRLVKLCKPAASTTT